RLSLDYIARVFEFEKELRGRHRHARDQLLRASQAIALNIAEGNGKATSRDRRRYFEIARGSALECAAIHDILQVAGALSQTDSQRNETKLERIVAMLTKLDGRGYAEGQRQTRWHSERDALDSGALQ
ncbi:MAG: four helix bundle protein, partial [Planctomycetota bacterium]